MDVGHAYAQVGEATWAIETGDVPKRDYELLTGELDRLGSACEGLTRQFPKHECPGEVENLKAMVRISRIGTRAKRSGDIVGGVKYLLFWSDEHESEVLALRKRQRILEAHTHEALAVTVQTLKNAEKLSVNRLNVIMANLNETQTWVKMIPQLLEAVNVVAVKDIVRGLDHLIELFLVHFVELDKKYELLERGADLLSDTEFEAALAMVRSRLRPDTMIPPVSRVELRRLIRAETIENPEGTKILLFLPIIYEEKFQRAYLVPLPDPMTGFMMDMESMDVCYNKLTEHHLSLIHISEPTRPY